MALSRLSLTALLFGICAGACSISCSGQQVDEAASRLTFPNGQIQLDLVLTNTTAGATTQLTADLLAPVTVLNLIPSHATTTCTLAIGQTICHLTMPAVRPSIGYVNDLARYRIRYSLTNPAVTGTLALDHISPDLFELHAAAPSQIRRDADYTIRIRALHPLTHLPRADVPLNVIVTRGFYESDKDDEDQPPQPAVTDANGFASFTFHVPPDLDLETIGLAIESQLASFTLGTSQTLHIPTTPRFDLTTDKPLYQPGQTVHTRLLLLDRNGHATPSAKVRVDINDPDSTLVFRAEATTSAFGIATVDWPVPARMRLGEYRLEAELPDEDEGHQQAYASIRLSRYDLPTFVVEPTPDRPFYLPGSNATVDVHADYLFGKPVLHGHVRVVREDDREWNFLKQRCDTKEGKAVSGELDAKGHFLAHIDLAADLKQYKDNDRDSNEMEDLHFAAYLTDASTRRTEQRRFDIRITNQSLHLYVTAGNQAHGLPQQYYLAATLADGTPVEADVNVSLLPQETPKNTQAKLIRRALALQHLHTDASGLVRLTLPTYEQLLKLKPSASSPLPASQSEQPTLYLTARDSKGHSGTITHTIQPAAQTFSVHTNKNLYRPGDPLDITIDSADQSLPATVQVLRRTTHGDLLLATRNLTLSNGHTALAMRTDARFSGLIFVQVIALGTKRNTDGEDPTSIASHAVLFPRDNSLRVAINMSAETYKPGDEATASLAVRGAQDPDGDDFTPAPTALGLVAVDQAVTERNRTDNDFGGGNSEPFFFRPRFDFNYGRPAGGYTLPALEQLDMKKPVPPTADLAAEILLCNQSLNFDLADNLPAGDLAQAFRGFFEDQLNSTRVALIKYIDQHATLPTDPAEVVTILRAANIDLNALRDPWGIPYTVTFAAQSWGQAEATLHSNGPDKLAGTSDDFEISLANWRWFNGHQRELQNAAANYHQRTGRYIRALADLRDEMTSEGIPFDQWRDPWKQQFTYQFSIQQTRFTIEAYSPGDPVNKPQYAWQKGPYNAGTAVIDYTKDLQKKIDVALNHYVLSHPFPASNGQFQSALRAAGITPAQMTDPWHQPLFATFRSHSFFTDRVHTEAHAVPGGTPELRTTTTPVTAVSDIIDLRSRGPLEGKRRGEFLIASFSHVRSTQSAKEATASRPSRQAVFNGPTGDIAGTVADASGAVIPNVMVTATNVKTGTQFEQKSDQQGGFLIGPVPTGGYKVHFALPGFTDLIYDQVNVIARNTVTLDAKLAVSTENTVVEVTASNVNLQTMNAAVGSVVSNQAVMALPMVERGISSFATIQPGVVPAPPPPAAPGQTATPRLRDYFPETLLWRPEIITAPDGTATLHFPVADNITTWQLSAAASTMQGNTGAGNTQFRTFQPFFAAFDPPSVLTTGDTISLPVALRNYLDHSLSVTSSLATAPWFKLDGPASRTTEVRTGESASPVFRFTALTPVTNADQQFTATASETGDRIARTVTVHPNGEEAAVTTAAILSPGANTLSFTLPADTLANSTEASIRLYPNLGAHLRDALSAMVAYPNGCAEQILSIAWPSLLFQRYSASLPQKDAKLNEQTRLYLQEAYENLLGNQLPGGGFAYWQRDSDPDLALTAYAIEFLQQAREFITIDDKVINNAITYLTKQQQKDGRWIRVDRERKPHPEDTRANAMLTASIAAMISGAPQAGPLLAKTVTALQPFVTEFDEPYTLASYTIAVVALRDSARSDPAITRLRNMSLTENGGSYWSLETNTPFFGWGRAGRVESTSQVLRALLAAGAQPQDDLVTRGLLFLNHEQDRHSLWYSTQASARVLDVLAAIALRSPASASTEPANLTLSLDGRPQPPVPLPPLTLDAGPIYIPLGASLAPGAHAVTLTMPPNSGNSTAQLVANLYSPWPAIKPTHTATNNEQLRLTLAFSSTTPAPGKAVTATAHIERIGFRGYGMMIAELGLPPGADVDRASLESAMNASGNQLNHYEVLPDRILVYLWPRAGGLTFHFTFTPRYVVDALTAPSSVYDYYNPDSRLELQPTRFTMR